MQSYTLSHVARQIDKISDEIRLSDFSVAGSKELDFLSSEPEEKTAWLKQISDGEGGTVKSQVRGGLPLSAFSCLLALTVFVAPESNATAQQSQSNQKSTRVTQVFATASGGTPLAWVAPGPEDSGKVGRNEKFGITSTGVDLYWAAFVPPDGLRHPAVIVLHSGGFKGGPAGPANVAQDIALAGFLCLAVEYRLAPPHVPMNAPRHPNSGQNQVRPVDNGHYPAQTDDVQLAIRAARADPRCDGRVYCLGGSAGGSHALYMAATGTVGDDRPDLVVGCSGIYNMSDPSFIGQVCDDFSTCPHSACTNYLGIRDNYPNFTPSDIAALAAASPDTYLTSNTCPIFVMHSAIDGMGIPETFDLLIAKMTHIGLTESTSTVPQARKYKQATIPVEAYAHAFGYWDLPFDGVTGHPSVAETVVIWLKGGPPRN